MVLRLEEPARKALDRITASEHISDNRAINNAILEYDRRRVAMRDKLLQQIVAEDRDLLDRLAQ